MQDQATTIAIKDAMRVYGFDVQVFNRAVGGEDLSQILARAQAATAEFAGQEAYTLFQLHGGGNDLDGIGWPYNDTVIEQGLRDVINWVEGEGFPIASSTLSWRNTSAGGVDTVPYNDNIYIPVINELTPLWGGSRTVVDLWTALNTNQDWISGDGTHPTPDGYYETALYIGNSLTAGLVPTHTMGPRDAIDLKANGFGTLSTDANFSGNFELRVSYALNPGATSYQNLIGNSDNRDWVNVNHDAKTVYIKIANTFVSMYAPALPDADTNTHYITYYRRGSSVYVVWDNIYLGSIAVSDAVGGFNLIGVRSSSTRIDGKIWDVKLWTAGNSMDGTLILDLPINEVGQDVQSDLSPSGNDMTFSGVDQGEDWTTVQDWLP